MFAGKQVHFFWQRIACFLCLCGLYVLLWHKRNFVNIQPVSTLSTAINGPRSCDITVKTFTFPFVKTILARTNDISNNILNRIWTLLKNVNPSTKRQEKAIRLIFKSNFAHIDPHCRHWYSLLPIGWKVVYPNTLYLENTRLQWE